MKIKLTLPDLTLYEAKRAVILTALQLSYGNAEKAAKRIGIGASTMYRLINEMDITDKERNVLC